MIISLHV